MSNIYVISGFLGSGKTEIIKHILTNYLNPEDSIVLNNELTNTSIDTDYLSTTKAKVMEVNNGCFCCDYKEKFNEAIDELSNRYKAKNIILETSGVDLLSNTALDLKKFKNLKSKLITVINISNFESLLENYGVFYIDQLKNAEYLLLVQTDKDKNNMDDVIEVLTLMNKSAKIITNPFEENSLNEIFVDENINSLIEEEHSKHSCNPNIPLLYTDFIHIERVDFKNTLSREFIKSIDKFFFDLNQDYLIDLPRCKGIIELEDKNYIFDYVPGKIKLTQTNKNGNYLNVVCSALEKNKVINFFEKSFYC